MQKHSGFQSFNNQDMVLLLFHPFHFPPHTACSVFQPLPLLLCLFSGLVHVTQLKITAKYTFYVHLIAFLSVLDELR